MKLFDIIGEPAPFSDSDSCPNPTKLDVLKCIEFMKSIHKPGTFSKQLLYNDVANAIIDHCSRSSNPNNLDLWDKKDIVA